MAEYMQHNPADGTAHRAIRNDAVRLKDPRRWYVPTTDRTKWVSTWEEFRAAGGTVSFSEDQAEIELLLPEPYKFSIQFMGQ